MKVNRDAAKYYYGKLKSLMTENKNKEALSTLIIECVGYPIATYKKFSRQSLSKDRI
jgi:hypothetical protein